MIQDILQNQSDFFDSNISLIPSENYSFYKAYQGLSISDIGNRYCFSHNSTFSWAFPGHENYKEIQQEVEKGLKKLLKVNFLNLDGISWMNGLTTSIAAFTNPWDTIFTVHPKNGWHISTEKIAKKFNLDVRYIPFKDNLFEINYERFEALIQETSPTLIYVDQMNGLYPLWLKEISHIKKDIVKFYDISHNAAFVISGIHPHPLENWYTCFWGSTHKTIPGTHKFFFATHKQDFLNVYENTSRSFVSNNNILSTLHLWICLEKMQDHWLSYTQNIIKNNLFFAKGLESLGIHIIHNKGYSQNHQLFWYTNRNIQDFHYLLTQSWILTNILPLPFSNRVLWIRTWMQELTFLWGWYDEVKIILTIIKDILGRTHNIKWAKEKIKSMKKNLLDNFNTHYAI